MDLSKITIETERLRLEPVSYQYREESFREFTPEITQFMFPKSPEKIEEVDEYLKNAQERLRMGESFDMVVLKKDTGEFLGRGGIHEINTKNPKLGIWIKKNVHGHGYGREVVTAFKEWADTHLDYEYLVYPVDKRNISSRKIPESLGGVVKKEYKETGVGGQDLDLIDYHIFKTN